MTKKKLQKKMKEGKKLNLFVEYPIVSALCRYQPAF